MIRQQTYYDCYLYSLEELTSMQNFLVTLRTTKRIVNGQIFHSSGIASGKLLIWGKLMSKSEELST